jgi:anti-sigma B factor antagonist
MNYSASNHGSHLLLLLEGNLTDNLLSSELLELADTHLAGGGENLVLDLSRLNNLNSTGLNIFINLLNRYKGQQKLVLISAANERIAGILAITKLDTVFILTDTPAEALDYKLPKTHSNK